jgi:hypothetical protein
MKISASTLAILVAALTVLAAPVGFRIPVSVVPLPLTIPGLKVWYKADAITTLYDGAEFGSWSDSSGNGNNATQGSSALRPLFKTGIQNSLPGVLFDGSNDTMSFNAQSLTGDFDVFVVMRNTDAVSGSVVLTRAADSFNYAYLTPSSVRGGISGGSNLDNTYSIATGSVTALLQLNRSGTNYTAGKNGTLNPTPTAAGSNTQSFSILGGYPDAPSISMEGYVFEVLIYDGTITSDQRASIVSYLSLKWAY